MNKIISIVIVAVIILGAGVYFMSHAKSDNVLPVTQTPITKLKTDLQSVTPHFIDSSKANGQTLTPEEQKIKDDVVAVLLATNPGGDKDYYSGLWLDAIGTRYILVSQPSGGNSLNEIIDSQTGKLALIPGGGYYLAPEGRDVALYIDTQAIRTYTLDQADAVLVSGSQLSGNETYNSGTSDFSMVPVQTHTKDSITIAVFDSSQMVKNPDAQPNAMQTMNKKVRNITLSF